MQSELNNPSVSDGHPKGAAGVAHGVHGVHAIPPGPQDLSLIQDSLTDEDFNFSEKVTVNKSTSQIVKRISSILWQGGQQEQ